MCTESVQGGSKKVNCCTVIDISKAGQVVKLNIT